LDIYGAEVGDHVKVSSFDAGLSGEVEVNATGDLVLNLSPVGGLTFQAARTIPHLQVFANSSPDPTQITLSVFLKNFDPGVTPGVIVTEPDSEAGYAPVISYSPGEGAYVGAINFSTLERGLGRVQAFGKASNSVVSLQSTYRLQRAASISPTQLFSNDGNLSLYLETGSFSGNEAYFVIMPPGAVPSPVPAGLVLVGDPYDVTASGALATLNKPAVLSLHYDGALVNPAQTPAGLSIYWWNQYDKVWQAVPSHLDEDHKTMVASITTLGTYALLAPPGGWSEVLNSTFLPLIVK
jgi:hypothetical protein